MDCDHVALGTYSLVSAYKLTWKGINASSFNLEEAGIIQKYC
jgi:hypothetical protein